MSLAVSTVPSPAAHAIALGLAVGSAPPMVHCAQVLVTVWPPYVPDGGASYWVAVRYPDQQAEKYTAAALMPNTWERPYAVIFGHGAASHLAYDLGAAQAA